MVYRIREVDGYDEDISETIKELHDAVFAGTAPKVDPTRGHWWLAYAADDSREIAGFCGLTPTYSQPDSVGYLKRAGVLPWHRGSGLQRRFVRVREIRARKNGWKAIVTDTSDNPSSANNLIRCGYLMYAPDNPWGWRHTIYWKKEL